MPSIYQKALGSDFARLHPKIQERFGFDSTHGVASIGVGTMHHMWHGPLWTQPFLRLGARRRIMFPDSHDQTPFVVENYAYRDPFGRETVTWIRTFDFPRKPRRFDAYMIFSEQRHTVIDYLGTHQHLAVDLDLRVDHNGGLCFRSGPQRFYEHFLGFQLPDICTGAATVTEWFDDSLQKYRIDVNVKNPRLGPLFGYQGTFEATLLPTNHHALPPHLLPLRAENRE